MPLGPGKYDKICTKVRKKLKADGVILMVIGGVKGPGFSAQVPDKFMDFAAETLRVVAAQIDSDKALLRSKN